MILTKFLEIYCACNQAVKTVTGVYYVNAFLLFNQLVTGYLSKPSILTNQMRIRFKYINYTMHYASSNQIRWILADRTRSFFFIGNRNHFLWFIEAFCVDFITHWYKKCTVFSVTCLYVWVFCIVRYLKLQKLQIKLESIVQNIFSISFELICDCYRDYTDDTWSRWKCC